MKKLFFVPFLIMISVSVLSCSGQEGTSVVILSCVDAEGNELRNPVTISVNGITQTWAPGAPLIFDLGFDADIESVDVIAFTSNYRQISPVSYEVEKDLGLELMLTFTESYVLEPVTVRMEFILSPEETEIILTSRSDNSSVIFRGSQTMNLPEGVYEWQAGYAGYNSDSGTLAVWESGDPRANISLSRIVEAPQVTDTESLSTTIVEVPQVTNERSPSTTIVEVPQVAVEEIPEPEDGYLSMLILPEAARITLTDLTRGNIYNFNPIGLQQENLPPGQYEYRITAPEFFTSEGIIQIRELQTSSLELELVNTSATSAIDQAQQVETLSQALPIAVSFIQNPQQINSLASNLREELVDIYTQRVANLLFNSGEQVIAVDFLEALYNQMPENIRVRMEYGEILSQRGDYSRSREMFRGVYGQYSNRIPNDVRESVIWQARFRLARTYYREFYALDEGDFDAREEIGSIAISELSDVITRYQNARNFDNLQRFLTDAELMRISITRDLGY